MGWEKTFYLRNFVHLIHLHQNSCNSYFVKCFIYKGSKKADTYLFVKYKENFSRVPHLLLTLLGKLDMVMTLELSDDTMLAQASSEEVIRQVEESGFYLQLPHNNIKPNSIHQEN